MKLTESPMDNARREMIWDEAHVKALLRLLRSPARLIQAEPWRSWIASRGGLSAVYAYLRTAPLVPDQRALLELLLHKPHVPGQVYAAALNVSISTYFIRLRQLSHELADHLNAWSVQAAPSETAAPPAAPAPVEAAAPTEPVKRYELPVIQTSLVGAQDALAFVCEQLQQPSISLLTLTGFGGMGKTRLAVEVARMLLHVFSDGVCFVRLDSLADPDLVLIQINKALGIPETAHRTALEALQSWLQTRDVLLILDNFEHLLPARQLISTLLQTAPGVKLLVTSRVPLHIYGEHTFQVPALLLPNPEQQVSPEELAETPAVRLFLERARAVHADLALTPENLQAIAQICTHLDGIPLAIELAAARSNFLTPTAMLPYVERSLAFLTSGPHDLPARHRTLRNTIDWSYTLLDEQEQRLFRRLAVFSGGWTLEAALQVAWTSDGPGAQQRPDDLLLMNLLESLFDKHLILSKQGGPAEPPRFSMLELMRQYALDRLEACAEREPVQRLHAAYYLAIVEQAEPNLVGSNQQFWVEQLERERYNIHAALTWALAQRDVELVLRLTGAIWNFWHLRSYLGEAQHWLQRAIILGLAVAPQHPALIKVFWGAGWTSCLRNAWLLGEHYFTEALTLARAHGDRRGIALALQGLGYISQSRGEYERAYEHFTTSLTICRELGDIEEMAWSLDHLAAVAIDRDDYARAKSYLEESLRLFQQHGHTWATLHSLHRLGRVAFLQGDAAQARALCEASLRLSREMGTTWMTPQLLTLLAQIALAEARLEEAHVRLHEALPLYHELASQQGIAVTLEELGALAAAYGEYDRAAQLCGAAQRLTESLSGHKPARYDAQRHEQLLTTIRAHLSPRAFAEAWERGRLLPVEQLLSSLQPAAG